MRCPDARMFLPRPKRRKVIQNLYGNMDNYGAMLAALQDLNNEGADNAQSTTATRYGAERDRSQ